MSLHASWLHRRYFKCLPLDWSDAPKEFTKIGVLFALFDNGPQWISAPKPKNEADPKSYLKSLRFIGKHLYIENLNEIKKNDINYDRKQINYEKNSLQIRFCAMTKHQYICIDMLIVPS